MGGEEDDHRNPPSGEEEEDTNEDDDDDDEEEKRQEQHSLAKYGLPVWTLGLRELRTVNLYKSLVAEFLAMVMFIWLVIMLVVFIGEFVSSVSQTTSAASQLAIAIQFGYTIFILVTVTAPISGGHINPAVTLSLFLSGRCSFIRAALYSVVQYAGAILGALLVYAVQPDIYRDGTPANTVNPSFSQRQAMYAEMMGTLILIWTVQYVTDSSRRTKDTQYGSSSAISGPMAIGMSVMVAHLALIPISGTSINPARSLGTAVLSDSTKVWSDLWVFIVGPYLASFLGVFLYTVFLRSDGVIETLFVEIEEVFHRTMSRTQSAK